MVSRCIRTTSLARGTSGSGRLSFSASNSLRYRLRVVPNLVWGTGAISGCDVSTGIFTENDWFSCGSVRSAQ